MQQEGRRRRLRAPSPAMIVALIALVFAMSGTAVAASRLVSGDKLIKKASLSGNRLKKETVTGTQIKESTLGKVPSAAAADMATNATHATSTNTATNAAHATSADSAGSAAPSGAAGGSLAGSYPNPGIAGGAIGTSQFGAIPGARVYSSTGHYVDSVTSYQLTFDHADYKVGSVWSASAADRLTAPVAGRYLVTVSVEWSLSSAGIRRLRLLLDGMILAVDVRPGVGDSSAGTQTQTIYQLNAGDYIQADIFQDSGGQLTEYASSSTSGSRVTHLAPLLTMEWLGP